MSILIIPQVFVSAMEHMITRMVEIEILITISVGELVVVLCSSILAMECMTMALDNRLKGNLNVRGQRLVVATILEVKIISRIPTNAAPTSITAENLLVVGDPLMIDRTSKTRKLIGLRSELISP